MFMYDYVHSRHQYTAYDYMTHVGDTKLETKAFTTSTSIAALTVAASSLSPSANCKRGTAPVIIVWHRRRGVLADITVFNANRENTKKKRKTLDGVLAKDEATLKYIYENI